MYKKSIMVAATLALTPALASADTVLGLYVGGQYWDTDASGEYGVGSEIFTPGFEDKGQTSYYAALEHPVPLIECKNRENSLEFDGGYGRNDFSHRDYIYYEFFDNDIASFDAGINAMDLTASSYIREHDFWSTRLFGDGANGLFSDSRGHTHDRADDACGSECVKCQRLQSAGCSNRC